MKAALNSLRASPSDAEDEFDEIVAERDSKMHQDREAVDETSIGVWQLLRTTSLYLPLFVCVCMHLSQQLSGFIAFDPPRGHAW